MESSGDIIQQFVVALGFKTDEASSRKMQAQIVAISESVAGVVAAFAAMSVAAVAAATKVAASFDKIYYESGRTGASVQNIKALQYAFSQTGGSAQQATAAIENYARALRTNPGNAKFVKDLGVDLKADTADQIIAVIDKLKDKPYYVGQQYAEMLGIDEGTYKQMTAQIAQLKAYRAEYDKATKRFGLNTKDAADASNRLMHALGSLSMNATVFSQALLVKLIPAIESVVSGITKWIDSHPEAVTRIMNAIGTAADLVAKAFNFVLAAVTPVFDYLSDKAAEMNKDGSFLKTWEKIATVFERVEGAIRSVLSWLNQLDRATDMSNGLRQLGRFVGFIEGKTADFTRGGVQAASAIDGATSTGVGVGGGGGQPGILRRGMNAIKRAVGIGSASDASGGVARHGGNAEGARESYTFWRSKGLTHEQAAGLVGMEQGESQFNPRARGDGDLAHGAFQHHPDRRAKIQKALGINISTATHKEQLEAAYWEMTQGQERGFWDRIKQAKTPGEAAATGVRYFERPRDIAGESRLRGQYANSWAARFAGSPVIVPKPLEAPPAMPKGFNLGSFDVNKLGASPMGSQSLSNDNSRSIKQNNPVTVTIQAQGDPATAANVFERSMNRVNETALRNAQLAIR